MEIWSIGHRENKIDRFCHIGIADEGLKKSALNRNIKAIKERTWEMINRDILVMPNKKTLKRVDSKKGYLQC